MIPVLGTFSVGMLADMPARVTFTDLPPLVLANMHLDVRLDRSTTYMYNRFMARHRSAPCTENRNPIKLNEGDAMIYVQYQGPPVRDGSPEEWEAIPDHDFRFRIVLVEVERR